MARSKKSLCQVIVKRLSEERELREVVEFGCGRGYYTRVIARNSKHVTATDLSDEMLEMARMELGEFGNVSIEKADSEDTSYPSDMFDTVFIANAVNTFENPLKALEESYRVLKAGGLLLIVNYTVYGMKWTEKIRESTRFLRRYGLPPIYIRNYSPEKLARLAESADFRVVEIQLIGDRAKAVYLKARKRKIET